MLPKRSLRDQQVPDADAWLPDLPIAHLPAPHSRLHCSCWLHPAVQPEPLWLPAHQGAGPGGAGSIGGSAGWIGPQ